MLDADDSQGHFATCVELLPRAVGGRAGEKSNVENPGDCEGHDQAGQRRIDCHLRRLQQVAPDLHQGAWEEWLQRNLL